MGLAQNMTRLQDASDAHTRSLLRVESGLQRLFSGLLDALAQLRTQLSEECSEQLTALRMDWGRQLDSLETLISKKSDVAWSEIAKKLSRIELCTADFVEEAGLDERIQRNFEQRFSELKTDLGKALSASADRSEGRTLEVLSELRAVQAQLAQVIRISLALQVQFDGGMRMLQNTIVNVNQRVCPTTFILLDAECVEKKTPNAEPNAAMRMKELFGTLSNPVGTIKEALRSRLKEREYIALVCEVCRRPRDQPGQVYMVDRPLEVVAKVLPLAKLGLKFVSAVNSAASLGRCFGLPWVDGQVFVNGQAFLTELGQDSLDNFEHLQVRTHRASVLWDAVSTVQFLELIL